MPDFDIFTGSDAAKAVVAMKIAASKVTMLDFISIRLSDFFSKIDSSANMHEKLS